MAFLLFVGASQPLPLAMILETLRYTETKHALNVRKFLLMESFRVNAVRRNATCPASRTYDTAHSSVHVGHAPARSRRAAAITASAASRCRRPASSQPRTAASLPAPPACVPARPGPGLSRASPAGTRPGLTLGEATAR